MSSDLAARWALAAGLTVASLVWAAAIVLAPAALARASARPAGVAAATMTYAVGSLVCHQRPDRSFRRGGLALPVCARCTGLYLAAPFGALLGLRTARGARRRRDRMAMARLALGISAVPTLVTVAAEYGLGVPVSGVTRAIAAAPLAAVVAWIAALASLGALGPVVASLAARPQYQASRGGGSTGVG